MTATPGPALVRRIASMISGFKPAPNIGMTDNEQTFELARTIAALALEASGAAHLSATIERLDVEASRLSRNVEIAAACTLALRPFVEHARAQGLLPSDIDNDLLMMSTEKHKLLALHFARALAAWDLEEYDR